MSAYDYESQSLGELETLHSSWQERLHGLQKSQARYSAFKHLIVVSGIVNVGLFAEDTSSITAFGTAASVGAYLCARSITRGQDDIIPHADFMMHDVRRAIDRRQGISTELDQ